MALTRNSGGSRLAFIDWTRGLAAAIMLQGHVFHAFARTDLRNESPYVLSQFVGGMPPAIFLFLTGVTYAFLMASLERNGVAMKDRVISALLRARYLFILAFAFRIQLWLFGWPAPWTDLLKVDILNCMGLAMLLLAFLAVLTTAQRVRAGALVGAAIACASPLVSLSGWGPVPAIVRNYLAPDYNYFGFFPWAAFLAFGISAGSILRLVRQEQFDRLMQWSCLTGIGLILAGQYFSGLPYSLYANSEFWLNSPMLIFIKLGLILVVLSFAYLWSIHHAGEKWSWLRQLGTTSLLVYWVHIELVYGWWFWFWKEKFTALECVASSVLLMLLMLGLSVARTRWDEWRPRKMQFINPFFTPRRVPGD